MNKVLNILLIVFSGWWHPKIGEARYQFAFWFLFSKQKYVFALRIITRHTCKITTIVLFHLQEQWEHPLFTQSISWLLMTLWRKEPGHQQPWHWTSLPGIFTVMVRKSCISSKANELDLIVTGVTDKMKTLHRLQKLSLFSKLYA